MDLMQILLQLTHKYCDRRGTSVNHGSRDIFGEQLFDLLVIPDPASSLGPICRDYSYNATFPDVVRLQSYQNLSQEWHNSGIR
jgi:hypothetical protein